MRGYDRDEMYAHEDLDEYEDEEQDEEVEEYEEEQEDPKPTKEELEYLALRQKMKEAARRKMKKENGVSFGNSLEKKKKLPYDNFGSFFGPSKPVIAQRVIQESKSLLENQHLAARISNATNGQSKKAPASTNSHSRPAAQVPRPTVNFEAQAKLKAQKLKDNRDYSFLLSEDSELPAPRKEPLPSMPNSDARSAQAQSKSRQSVSNHSKPVANSRDERKSAPTNRHMHAKAGNQQGASGSRRPNMAPADSRKQLGSNSGTGPGRPMGQKGLPAKTPLKPSAPPKANPSNKFSTLTLDKKTSLVGSKKPVTGVQKAQQSKMQSSGHRQHFEQRREVREQPEKAKLNSKMSVASSKPQMKAPKQMQQRAHSQVDRPKKRPAFDEDEEDDPRALIRQMFRYDPRKYADVDEDVSDMEADFHSIQREEKKSARIAKEEDERELLLIEEEERKERLRKEAKRRKR